MVKHGNDLPSLFSWQNIMASGIMTETYSQIMAEHRQHINLCFSEKKTRRENEGKLHIIQPSREILTERVNFYPLSQIVPHYNVSA